MLNANTVCSSLPAASVEMVICTVEMKFLLEEERELAGNLAAGFAAPVSAALKLAGEGNNRLGTVARAPRALVGAGQRKVENLRLAGNLHEQGKLDVPGLLWFQAAVGQDERG